MITFYYLSGSPFSWRIWLALEHMHLKFDLVVLSRDAGDLRTEDYLALNPHGKAPTIVHNGFTLYEANAIGEYLHDTFSTKTMALWPADTQDKSIGRQMLSEIDSYIYPHTRKLVEELLLRSNGCSDTQIVNLALRNLNAELPRLAKMISTPFLLGKEPSLADFALFPLIAILERLQKRFPDYFSTEIIPAPLKTWRLSIMSLPYFEKTLPPHW